MRDNATGGKPPRPDAPAQVKSHAALPPNAEQTARTAQRDPPPAPPWRARRTGRASEHGGKRRESGRGAGDSARARRRVGALCGGALSRMGLHAVFPDSGLKRLSRGVAVRGKIGRARRDSETRESNFSSVFDVVSWRIQGCAGH